MWAQLTVRGQQQQTKQTHHLLEDWEEESTSQTIHSNNQAQLIILYMAWSQVSELGLVHNMTLLPALHCLCHKGDARIELISIPALRVYMFISSVQQIRLSKFWTLRKAFWPRTYRFFSAHNARDAHSASVILWTRPYTHNTTHTLYHNYHVHVLFGVHL